MKRQMGDYEKAFKSLMTVLLGVLLSLMTISGLWAGPWTDSGQTKCYNNTVEIPCPAPGEPFYGQDGNYSINPPSYTKLGQNGIALPDSAKQHEGWIMTRDNVTGLIWENKAVGGGIHDKRNLYTWCDKNPATNGGNEGTCGKEKETGELATDTEGFIKALNDSNFGGFSNWRMPTQKELQSIVDYSRWYPAIDMAYFPATTATTGTSYWSSTPYVSSVLNGAWRVGFDGSTIYYVAKSHKHGVRAVRGAQAPSSDHFVDNGDGTVTDTITGLMWQKRTSSTTQKWEEALKSAKDLTLAGYDDWRLPTVKELQSIVDFSIRYPVVDTAFFPRTLSFSFWSSTTCADRTDVAWGVSFWGGEGAANNKLQGQSVRAIRGGQSRLTGRLKITTPAKTDKRRKKEKRIVTWDAAGVAGNVKISLSRKGGKSGTFETIIDSVRNVGTYDWTVTGPASVNCVLKIEPLDDLSKGTSQGLFIISEGNP
jgi:hypothetical protein